MNYRPYPYQTHAGRHLRDNPYCGLFLDMGLGKTVVTLTEIEWMIYHNLEVARALVIGPKRVVQSVWMQEAQEWDHLKHLKFSLVWGDLPTRIKALKAPADIYLINREHVAWLVTLMQSSFYKFDIVVIDESSSFKDQSSKRFRALKLVRPQIKRLVLLSGTPAPNSLMDLWSQLYLLDEGERLGKTITGFRQRYFFPEKMEGHIVYSYKAHAESKNAIYSKIGDICISMKLEDYHDLPDLIENNIYIDMEHHVREQYNQFEKDQVTLIKDKEVTALSAAALSTKLLQFASGSVYHEDKQYSDIHSYKLDALEELMEEAQGNSVLVLYSYRHGLERIMRRFKQARQLKTPQDILDWNLGKIPMMVAHPASMSHGLNLQKGGHILIWYGQTWSLELYLQTISRLRRLGQGFPVIMHRLVVRKTLDEAVIKALALKEAGQDALMEAIKAIIDKHR